MMFVRTHNRVAIAAVTHLAVSAVLCAKGSELLILTRHGDPGAAAVVCALAIGILSGLRLQSALALLLLSRIVEGAAPRLSAHAGSAAAMLSPRWARAAFTAGLTAAAITQTGAAFASETPTPMWPDSSSQTTSQSELSSPSVRTPSSASTPSPSSSAPSVEPSETHDADTEACPSGSESRAEQVERHRPERRTYTVRRGDSLWSIAHDHGGPDTSVARLYSLNRDVVGDDPDLITPGLVLDVP